MLLLSKYLDYRIKVGDCSLEWNPLIIPASAAEQTAVANIDEDAMQVDQEQSGSTNDESVNKDAKVHEVNEETMFFRDIAPGLKIIILKELCDWQIAADGPIHEFYSTLPRFDDSIFGLDASGNRILHFGANGIISFCNE
jgi:hypothetical protein